MSTEPPPKEISVGEWAVIGISCFMHAVQILSITHILINRHYAPFKAKQILLLFAGCLCALFWTLGLLQACKILPEVSILKICPLWHIWFNLTFGLWVWLNLLNLRFWKLYFLFKLQRKTSNFKMNIFFFVLWSPSLVFGVVGSIMRDSIFYSDPTIPSNCVLENSFLYGLYAYTLVQYLVSLFFVISLRNLPHRAFNELSENRRTLLIGVIFMIIFVCFIATDQNRYLYGRIVSFLSLQVICHFTYWSIVGYSQWRWFTDKEAYEKEFKENLAKDSMTAVKRNTISLEPLTPIA